MKFKVVTFTWSRGIRGNFYLPILGGLWLRWSKIQWHISLAQDATAFQAEVVAILDCVTSCLRKRLVKEQITICTDSQAAVAAIAASGTKSLLVTDCIEKLTVL